MGEEGGERGEGEGGRWVRLKDLMRNIALSISHGSSFDISRKFTFAGQETYYCAGSILIISLDLGIEDVHLKIENFETEVLV